MISQNVLLVVGFCLSFSLFMIGKKIETMVPYPIKHTVYLLSWMLSIFIFCLFLGNYFTR